MSGYKRVNFYELCRLCATHQQREKTHIFEEKGRKIQLQDKIQNCLSLQVCENDYLPKVVCSECIQSLEQSCIFRQECYTSETMLVSYFNNFRHTEEFKKSGKVYIKDTVQKSVGTEVEMDLTVTPTPITMATASTNTDFSVNLVPNVMPDIMSSFYTLQLPPALTPALHGTPMVAPLVDNHKIITQPIVYGNKAPNLIKTGDAISITVNSNGEIIGSAPIFDANPYLKMQRKTPVDMDKTALNQSVIYNQIQPNFNRVTNITNMNVISVPFDSAVPGESSASTPSPPNYMPDVFTPVKPQSDIPTQDECLAQDKKTIFSCSICLKNFKRREHLGQHVKLHSGFRPYKCENCNKSYIRKEHLMRHLTSHNGEKKFMCETCERSFSRHDNLLKHRKTHDKQINYTCDVCQRKFLLEHFYLAHKLSHENEKCAINQTWNLMKVVALPKVG